MNKLLFSCVGVIEEHFYQYHARIYFNIKGYGNLRIQYADWVSVTGTGFPGKNIGQMPGPGWTLGFSITWTGVFGVTTCIRISCAIEGPHDLKNKSKLMQASYFMGACTRKYL